MDETLASGSSSAATTPDSETSSSVGDSSSTDADRKTAKKTAARYERFRKMKEKLADAIWNQSEYQLCCSDN